MALQAVAWRALAPLALVWFGIVIGVSLLAAPVPFMAEGLTRAESLSVNRELFRMLTWTEEGLLVLLLILAVAARTTALRWVGLIALTAIVLVQGFVLLPELARRTDVVLAGGEPAPGPEHTIYVGLEFAKIALLAAFGLWPKGPPRRQSAARPARSRKR